MKHSQEFEGLIHRQQQILSGQDMYLTEGLTAKKHFAEIDFQKDDYKLDQMCQSTYENGEQEGDQKLLNLLVEARELMHKQERDIREFEVEVKRNYQAREQECEAQLLEIRQQLLMLEC